MHPQSAVTTSNRQTHEELARLLTWNIRDEEAKQLFLRDPRVALSLDVASMTGARQQRCGANAEDGRVYLQSLGYRDVQIALGFMVIHEYWRISVIEHAWLVIDGTQIIDPTLPFLLVTQWPTYFQGAIETVDRPYPDLRNRQYKAAFLQAKQLAETCEYPFMATAKRRIHIGRINWIEGLNEAEGRVSR